jgi:hypothetical protein
MNKFKPLFIVANIALLSGCVTSRQVVLPSGARGLAINCPGMALDIGHCMNAAAEKCGGPYSILAQDGQVLPATAATIGQNVFITSGVTRTMIVQCAKELPPPVMPPKRKPGNPATS